MEFRLCYSRLLQLTHKATEYRQQHPKLLHKLNCFANHREVADQATHKPVRLKEDKVDIRVMCAQPCNFTDRS